MIKEKNKFRQDDILTKEFVVELKGYKIEDVDSFLDEISKDYKYFEGEIKNLKEQLEQQKAEYNRVLMERNKLETANKEIYNSQASQAREAFGKSDVISRVSNLESQNAKIIEILQSLQNK